MRLFIVALALVVSSCGSAGRQGDGDDDSPPTDGPPDDTTGPPGDSPTVTGLGSSCTPDQANPQGTCPVGFTCLNLQGGTNPWCSKTCQMANDTCAVDYTGPGKPQCVLTVTPAGGGAPQDFCTVICQDNTGSNQICPAAQCDGTCPGSLACTAPLSDGTNDVALACE